MGTKPMINLSLFSNVQKGSSFPLGAGARLVSSDASTTESQAGFEFYEDFGKLTIERVDRGFCYTCCNAVRDSVAMNAV